MLARRLMNHNAILLSLFPFAFQPQSHSAVLLLYWGLCGLGLHSIASGCEIHVFTIFLPYPHLSVS